MKMDLIYSVFLEMFPVRPYESESRLTSLIIFELIDLVVFIQNIQFFWFKNLPIHDWSEYSSFWTVLCIPALDRFLSNLNFLYEFFYFVVALQLWSFILILGMTFQKYFKRPVKAIHSTLARYAVTVQCRVLFIPSLSVLFYALSPLVSVNSINSRMYLTGLNVSTEWQVITVLLILLHLFITFCYEATHFEMRPKPGNRYSISKIDAKNDIILKLVQSVNIFLSIFLDHLSQQLLLIYYCVVYGTTSFFMLYSVPYYSDYVNFTKFFFQFDLMFISLAFLIGLATENSKTILVLSVVMQPVLVFLAYSTINYRKKLIFSSRINPKSSFLSFERRIRRLLRNGDDEGLLAKLNKNYSITKDKRNLVITSYYCNDVIKSPSLSLNKIFNANHEGLNIVLNYQVYKCKEFIRELCKEHSLTYKIYQYILSLIQIRYQDKTFCSVYNNYFKVVLGKHQNLTDIKNSVNLVIDKITVLEQHYENIISCFPSSNEVKDLYESFLCCIKGEILKFDSRRKNKYKSSIHHEDNFKSFIKSKALIMFSGKEKDFGTLLFTNQEFISLFRYSKVPSEDFNVNLLIPKILIKPHSSLLLKFIESSLSNIVFEKQVFYFVDCDGYIVECKMRGECIALDEQTNFIYSIEKMSKHREMAIMSKHGWIFEHSHKFAAYLGIKNKNLNGSSFSFYFPEISLKDLEKGKVLQVNLDDVTLDVCLILKKVNICSTKFYMLFVLKEFRGYGYVDDSSFFNTCGRNEDSLSGAMTIHDTEKPYVKEINEKDLKHRESRMTGNSTSNSTISLNSKELNSFKRSILVLNITKVILIILILSLIASNLAILIYISQEVNHALSLDALMNLNYLSYSLTQCALILRSRDINFHISKSQYYSNQDFDNILASIKKYQSDIFNDLDGWKYCSSSQIVESSILPCWDIGQNISVRYKDIFNFVEFIRINAKAAYDKMNAGLDYKHEMISVLANTLEGPFNKILGSIDKLVTCETTRVDNLEYQRTYLLLGGIIVLAISVLIITIYVKISDYHLNTLWENLRIRSLSQAIKIRQALSERLSEYHNKVDSVYEEIESFTLKESKKFEFRHYLFYLSKLSILFLIATMFLLLTTLVFYSNIRDSLYYRPLLVSSFPRRRVQLSELAFVVLESKAVYYNYSLTMTFPEFSNLLPLNLSITDKINYIKKTGKYINNPNTKLLMSDMLYNKIFFNYPNSSPFLSAGTYRAVALLNHLALFIINTNNFNNDEIVDLFMTEIIEFNNAIDFLSEQANIDSKNKIQIQQSNMILFIAFVGVLLLLLYFFYYLPMIKREIMILKNIVKILKLLPR